MHLVATKAVIEGSEINILQREEDTWFALSRKEMDGNYQFDEDNLFLIDEEYLFSRIPKLRGKLDQPNKTTINIDYETGEVNINKQHFHLGIPTHFAKATRQADSRFNFFHYMITTRQKFKKAFIILSILLILAVLLWWPFYIPFAIYAGIVILETLKTRDLYYSGALCPAIVIDAANHKIAAYTDLSLGFGTYPIIRIIKYPLPKEYLVNGKKIPVAGGYQNTENYSHWNYYEPQPIPSATKDKKIIDEKINQIPMIEWIELKNQINKFEEIPKEGYYPIKIETSNWKDINLDEVEWMQFGEEK